MKLRKKLLRAFNRQEAKPSEFFQYRYERPAGKSNCDYTGENSLAVFVGGLAHDMNNLLTAVIGHAELALSNLGENDPSAALLVRRQLQNIHQAGCQMSDITNELLTFAGLGRREISLMRLESIIREKLDLERLCLRKEISLVFKSQNAVPRIAADRNELMRVIDSLVSNSSDAIGAACGRIELTVEKIHGEEIEQTALVDPSYLRKSDSYVALRVEDTGSGMSQEVQRRMFDPFFTTKFIGRGLGLAAVRGIVRAHGWGVMVCSTEGVGTTVTVLFPVEEKSAGRRECEYSLKQKEKFVAKGGSIGKNQATRVRYSNGLLQRTALRSAGTSTTH